MWKSGRNINSRRAALAEGYMEDTQESRGRSNCSALCFYGIIFWSRSSIDR